jgi:hypothetical protein
LRYLKIRGTAFRYELRGEARKCAQKHTTNRMSDHVIMRYKRESIMLVYSL